MKVAENIDCSDLIYDSDLDLVPLKENKILYISLLVLAVPFIFPAFIPLWIIWDRHRKKVNKVYEDFAIKNNWEPIDDSGSSLLKFIALEDTKYIKQHQYSSNFMGYEFKFYEYVFNSGNIGTKPSDSNKNTISVIEMDLKKDLPYMILDSKNNDRIINRINQGLNKYSLESVFDDYFQLYFEKGKHVDVLSIVSPDVMQVLIDLNSKFDIIIKDKKLFIAIPGSAIIGNRMEKLFIGLDSLLAEIDHRSKSFKDTPNFIESNELNNRMKRITYLKRGTKLVLMVYIVFSIFAFFIWLFDLNLDLNQFIK
jgi:hypothetical protein